MFEHQHSSDTYGGIEWCNVRQAHVLDGEDCGVTDWVDACGCEWVDNGGASWRIEVCALHALEARAA
jgi:hypothetical protein